MNADAFVSITKKIGRRIGHFVREQIPLFEAFCVALSFHVFSLPFLWIMGWALPWPRSPVITTVIEFDLRNWKDGPRPRSVKDIYYPEMNK